MLFKVITYGRINSLSFGIDGVRRIYGLEEVLPNQGSHQAISHGIRA